MFRHCLDDTICVPKVHLARVLFRKTNLIDLSIYLSPAKVMGTERHYGG